MHSVYFLHVMVQVMLCLLQICSEGCVMPESS